MRGNIFPTMTGTGMTGIWCESGLAARMKRGKCAVGVGKRTSLRENVSTSGNSKIEFRDQFAPGNPEPRMTGVGLRTLFRAGGGLMSYGINPLDPFRRAAGYFQSARLARYDAPFSTTV